MKNPKPASRSTRRSGRSSTAYHHGDLRVALIAAARQILEQEGFTALSLRSTARTAGVSQSAPYHHFADKDALLAAVATQGFEELARTMEVHMDRAQENVARLHASGVGYVSFAVANPALFRLMFAGSQQRFLNDAALAAAGQGAYAILESAVVAMLQDTGRPHSEVPLASLTAWSVVHGLAKLLIETALDPTSYGAPDAASLTEELLARMHTQETPVLRSRKKS